MQFDTSILQQILVATGLVLTACSPTAAPVVPPALDAPPIMVEAPPPPTMEPAPPPRPQKRLAQGEASVTVRCRFSDGWVSLLPAARFDPGEQFLMQALIGLTEEPKFWGPMPEYAKLEPYKAQRCAANGVRHDVPAGSYYVLVGWAGQFSVRGKYQDNGFKEKIELGNGDERDFDLSPKQLKHTWFCISCPYLVIWRDGRWIDHGQVLVDRYSRRRSGTDVVRAEVQVQGGKLRLRIDEREPEVTHLDAVQVSVAGKRLKLRSQASLAKVDSKSRQLAMGQKLELVFDAAGLADGKVQAEIRVSGFYLPIGPLR